MRKLVIILLSMGLVSTGQAQEVTKMEPVKVVATSFSMELDPATNSINLLIPEKQVGSFHRNPLKFVKNNFDIQQLIKDNDSKYDSYLVTFKSPKGKLFVNYDKKGKTVSTFQTFKNVELPHGTYLEIYRDYRDWDIVGNKYVAASRNGNIKKEFYKIKLQNGKRDKFLKINVYGDKSMLGLALQ